MFRISEFCTQCEEVAAEGASIGQIEELVANAIANGPAVLRALPASDEEEVLLHHSPRLVVVLLQLTPNVLYPPHDHQMAAVIGVTEGSEHHLFYHPGDGSGPMEPQKARCLTAGKVLVLGPDSVHAVVNSGSTRSSSLHVYIGDLIRQPRTIWNPETRETLPYSDATYFSLTRPFDSTKPFRRPRMSRAHSIAAR